MEDFSYAGGVPAVMKEIASRLHLDALTATGKTLGENISRAACFNREVIKPFEPAALPEGGLVVLGGNLAPAGRGDQAIRLFASFAPAQREGGGVREQPRLAGSH